MSVLHLELSAKRAKRVAKLLSNDTACRIMDSISDESKSETALSKELSIPLSTIHYNMQQLLKEGLVISDEYTYSEKGREMRHYRLASQHVLITTRPVGSVSSILSGAGLALVVAFGIAFFTREPAIQQQARVAESAALMAADAATVAPSQPALWPWILLGAITVIVGILIAQFILRRRA